MTAAMAATRWFTPTEPSADTLIVDLENPQFNTLRAAGDTLTSIENITYNGIYWADLAGDGNDNVITTGGEQCLVYGRGGDDRVVSIGVGDTMVGDEGIDTLDYSQSTEGVVSDPTARRLDPRYIRRSARCCIGLQSRSLPPGSDFADTLTLFDRALTPPDLCSISALAAIP